MDLGYFDKDSSGRGRGVKDEEDLVTGTLSGHGVRWTSGKCTTEFLKVSTL